MRSRGASEQNYVVGDVVAGSAVMLVAVMLYRVSQICDIEFVLM